VSRFVIDALIVLVWCFPDEHADLAEHVAGRFQRGDTALAPSFWPHEVLNALLVGEKRKRISSGLVQSFLDDVAALPVALAESSSDMVFGRIQSLSRSHSLTSYDAAYLDLALGSGLPLATMDAQLIRACKRAQVELVGG
jgi:predicted nucleic acid-binding protein